MLLFFEAQFLSLNLKFTCILSFQDVIIMCDSSIENQNSDLSYWSSEIRKFSSNIPMILAENQVHFKTTQSNIAKEIGADIHLKYSEDNSDGSINKVFETAVKFHLMKNQIVSF